MNQEEIMIQDLRNKIQRFNNKLIKIEEMIVFHTENNTAVFNIVEILESHKSTLNIRLAVLNETLTEININH